MTNDFISSIWDFRDVKLKETGYATHDFLRWYGKLIPQLVSKLINLYSKEHETILANFMGSGTVLLEANILNRDSIGVDSSPLSNLLSKVKTTPYKPDSQGFLSELEADLTSKSKVNFDMDYVDEKWYDQQTFNELMIIRDKILKLTDKRDKDYYLLALAAITRKVSRIDSRCINHIVVDNNKTKCNLFLEFKEKINEMNGSMEDFMKIATKSKIDIHSGDSRNLNFINDNSIDMVISHPPYLGYINYSNIFKLANKIIGFDYESVKENDISTNSLTKYLQDMDLVFGEMYRVLKNKKYACVIIGDNRVNGDLIPTFSYFIESALKRGFKLKDVFIWIMSQKAGMSIKRRGNHVDHNYILIFQKE